MDILFVVDQLFRLFFLFFKRLTNSNKQLLGFAFVDGVYMRLNFIHIRRNFDRLQMNIVNAYRIFSFLISA